MIVEGTRAVALVIIHKPCNMTEYILAGNLNHGMMNLIQLFAFLPMVKRIVPTCQEYSDAMY